MKTLSEQLTKAGFEVVDSNGLKALWQPGDDELTQALEYGRKIAGRY